MKKAISVILSLVMLILLVCPVFAANDGIVLASNSITAYSIVIGENATETEVNAAATLADYLNQITGAEFEIIRDSADAGSCEIVVGVTNRENENPVDRSELGEDGVRIFTDGKKLFLTGAEKRGAIYAVYTFLEEFLGCRWFVKSIPLTPDRGDLIVVPEVSELVIDEIDYTYVPPFKLRQTYWMFSTMYVDYSVAHKLHGMMAGIPESLGGIPVSNVVNAVHTMSGIVTADMFAEHPEYFGMDSSGNRSIYRQPCFSNEDVFNLTVAAAKAHCSKYESIFSVSQNDGADFCQCSECTSFNAAHGNVDSASLLNFVNRVAVEVRKEYPDAKIETLAYHRSETPPTGLTVEENVVIRVCPIDTCVLHELDDESCPTNAEFDANLTGWSELTDTIYVWDYSTNFQYIYAFYPNISTLQSRYQYFRDRNVVAVFDHGCGEDIVPAELHELRTYLVCKLLWNPDTDIEMHIREFCDAYYGEAADDVISFIGYFEDAVKGYNATAVRNCHMTCQDGGESLENNSSLTEIDVAVLDGIVRDAKSRNLNEDQQKRIEGFELSWRFFKNATWAGEFNWFLFWNDPEEESKQLYYDMKEYGVMYLAEAWGVYFREEEPNFLVRPTFWYHTEDELPQSAKLESSILPVINKILRYAFALPRFFMGLFE